MRVVDDVVLEVLGAAPFEIHDGLVEADNTTNVVTYELPYAVFYSAVGSDGNPRLSRGKGRRSVFFTLIYVGLDRNQVKWAGEALRDLLADKRLGIPGHKSWPCELLESQRIRRDDDAIRPDGSPLFYGVDNYALPITLTH